MVPQMIASRRVMVGLGLDLSLYTFGPVFAALHRLRRSLTWSGRDAWPAICLALEEFEYMQHSGITPNAKVLTNLALTVGLSNQHADPARVHDGQDERIRSKLQAMGGDVARQLEAMLTQAHNPNVYVALMNLGGSAGAVDDVHAVWQALVSEAQISQAAADGTPLMTSLTLAAYMNALIACKQYHEAISAFFAHAYPALPGDGQRGARVDGSKPHVPNVGRPVYDAAIRAFARAGQHQMCERLVRSMINGGVPPTALTVRYTLLHPDPAVSDGGLQQNGRRWALPLSIAREIWAMVLNCRQMEWARGPLPEPVDVTALQEDQLPVIANDIAAQFIRIAAYACDTRFGEEVYKALCAEAAHYRMRHGHHKDDDSASNNAAEAEADADVEADVEAEAGTEAGTEAGAEPAISSDGAMAEGRFREFHDCAPNVYTYTSMISLYSNSADLNGVQTMWAKMLDDGIEPRIHTYTSLVVALHRVALRRRWKQTREHAENAASSPSSPRWALPTSSPGTDAEFEPMPSAKDPQYGRPTWAQLTPQDETIWRVEDWLLATTAGNAEAAASAGDINLSLDIPLSTLLLRYHSLRIHEVTRVDQAHQDDRAAVEDIERIMRVCQALEQTGLQPDRRFHAALADFFDTCGDPTGANLVRERMGSLGGAR
ncbi:hypothetical protein H4R19_003722 [Coemansia spiralis]|nr:hypothetical protein H4R19_003722 [Coemansia spiralis]